jgi:hypothetical protein
MNSLAKDLQFGLSNESKVIEILSKHFGETIQKTEYKYCPYDALSETCKYEIKTRRNRYETYPTTIVPQQKVETIEGSVRYVFCFTNGIYYIDYDEDLFSTFKVTTFTYYRLGTKPNPVPHIEIPIDRLTRIE